MIKYTYSPLCEPFAILTQKHSLWHGAVFVYSIRDRERNNQADYADFVSPDYAGHILHNINISTAVLDDNLVLRLFCFIIGGGKNCRCTEIYSNQNNFITMYNHLITTL